MNGSTRKASLWVRALVQLILVIVFGSLTLLALVATPLWGLFFLLIGGPFVAWRRTFGIWRAYLSDVIEKWRNCTAIANGTHHRCATPGA